MNHATKFRAEKWTTISSSTGSFDQWAVVMLDGDEANSPCAFGLQASMEEYAEFLNSQNGVIAEC